MNRCPEVRAAPPSGVAFTLIEMLITVVVVLVLATLYWGNMFSSPQSRRQACQRNLQKIYVALEIYANDHASQFPAVAGARTSEEALDLLVPRYTADTAVFVCPGSKDSTLPAGESIRKRRISYAYYMGRRLADSGEALMSDRQVDTQSKTSGLPVFSSTGEPPGNNHKNLGGNFLFCDGRVDPSPDRVAFSLVLTQGVVLLNPKP